MCADRGDDDSEQVLVSLRQRTSFGPGSLVRHADHLLIRWLDIIYHLQQRAVVPLLPSMWARDGVAETVDTFFFSVVNNVTTSAGE